MRRGGSRFFGGRRGLVWGVIRSRGRGGSLRRVFRRPGLGGPGNYAVGARQLARRWQIRPAGLLGVRAGRPLKGVDTAEAWSAAYALVSGVLPVEDAPVLARAQVSVTTPGEVRMRVSG